MNEIKEMKEQFIHIDEDGNKFYYSDKSMAVRLRHREDGPAIEWADGSKAWFINGERHREDGPAIEDADGFKAWYIDDKCHREDGPAFEDADGREAWYIYGKKLTEEQFNDRNKVRFTYDDKELIIKCIEGAIIAATEPCEKDNPMYIPHAVCKIYDLKSLIRRVREHL